MTQEIAEILILLASSLERETAWKKSLCCFGNVKGPLRLLAYLYYPWLATWTPDINVDGLVSGWGKEKDVSQTHESSLSISQLFLSQQVMASMTACAIIVIETVAGFYLNNCVVTVPWFWQSLSVQTIWV